MTRPFQIASPRRVSRRRAGIGLQLPAPRRRLKIAMLAPPWIPIPAPGYGGVELVVEALCEGLVAAGHDVTMFAAPGSRSVAQVVEVLAQSHPDEIGRALFEADHVACVLDRLDAARADGDPYDVVHDHSGFVALSVADRVDTPMLHTLHGPFTPETSAFYLRHGANATLVAISEAQRRMAPPGLRIRTVIPNPVQIDAWPLVEVKDDYLLWIGRVHESKGPHRAIEAAKLAGRRLVLAGPVQPGQEAFFELEIAPHVDGDRVRYVGEVGGDRKRELFSRAAAMLMPIRWPEPFGMVMVEALACGTPVIAFGEGAATEIVIDGTNGFIVADETAMARAVLNVAGIDPAACRSTTRARFAVAGVADAYASVYDELAADRRDRRPARPLAHEGSSQTAMDVRHHQGRSRV